MVSSLFEICALSPIKKIPKYLTKRIHRYKYKPVLNTIKFISGMSTFNTHYISNSFSMKLKKRKNKQWFIKYIYNDTSNYTVTSKIWINNFF